MAAFPLVHRTPTASLIVNDRGTSTRCPRLSRDAVWLLKILKHNLSVLPCGHRRARADLLNGDVDNALKNYHLALSVNPDYEPAKEGIAQAMKDLNSNGTDTATFHHFWTILSRVSQLTPGPHAPCAMFYVVCPCLVCAD